MTQDITSLVKDALRVYPQVWNNPLVDMTHWEEDRLNFGKGIRFSVQGLYADMLVIQARDRMTLPLKQPHREPGPPMYSHIIYATPLPPADAVLAIWLKRWDRYVSGPGSGTYPFLTWSEYRTLWKYINDIATWEGDESYWEGVAQAQPATNQQDVYKLALVWNTSEYLFSSYCTILHRFGYSQFTRLSNDEWTLQAYLREVKNKEDYVHVLRELCGSLQKPPHIPIPNQSYFNLCVDTLQKLMQGERVTPLVGSYPVQAFPRHWTILRLYQKVYPTLDKEISTTNEALPILFLQTMMGQWAELIGNDALFRKDYTLLQEKWGVVIPIPGITELDIVLQKQLEIPQVLFQPCPSEAQFNQMKEFVALFANGDHTVLPLATWFGRIDFFFKHIKVNPLPNAYESKTFYEQLVNPGLSNLMKPTFEALCSVYFQYCKLVEKQTNGFTNEDYKWGKDRLTDKQRTRRAAKASPLADDYERHTWPEPWNLSKEDLDDYIDYVTGVEKGGCPALMARPPLMDENEYQAACRESRTGYVAWRKKMHTYQKTLEKFPLRSDTTAEYDGKPIPNWYGDYGVWDDGLRGWDLALKTFWSPVKALTGHSYWDLLLERCRQVFNLLLECLNKALNTLPWTEIALLLGAAGVALIGGVVLLDRVDNKAKR